MTAAHNHLYSMSLKTRCVNDDLDYSRLKRSLEFLVEQYTPTNVPSRDSQPIRLLERDERRSMTTARRHLSAAIADLVQATQGFSIEHILAADSERSAGVRTLFPCYALGSRGVAARPERTALAVCDANVNPAMVVYGRLCQAAGLILAVPLRGSLSQNTRLPLRQRLEESCAP